MVSGPPDPDFVSAMVSTYILVDGNPSVVDDRDDFDLALKSRVERARNEPNQVAPWYTSLEIKVPTLYTWY